MLPEEAETPTFPFCYHAQAYVIHNIKYALILSTVTIACKHVKLFLTIQKYFFSNTYKISSWRVSIRFRLRSDSEIESESESEISRSESLKAKVKSYVQSYLTIL